MPYWDIDRNRIRYSGVSMNSGPPKIEPDIL